MLDQAISFGPYRLDPRAGLSQGPRAVRLTPKAFSLLCFLAAERGRVVAKEELFRTVWRGAAVGDAALVSCVQELRRALRDKAGKPRYIETLHRRGYRFIAPPVPSAPVIAELPGFTGPDAALLVGRQVELEALQGAMAAARAGSRQVVLVAGEAGIGKTALVRAFFAQAGREAPVRLAWGQSAEHYGAAEPYHPILDALARCARTSAALLDSLEKHAPLWLAQMPSLLPAARLRALHRRTAGATRERMQRELTDALEAAAAELPLVLWLEDLHWADAPTIDWLASFARHPEPARVLVLGTYRPVEARAERHAIHLLRDELVRQGGSRTLAVGPLSLAAVAQYVAARFPPRDGEESALSRLAAEVFERTEGSPLFMVGVLSELASRGVLRGENGAWSVTAGASAQALDIPAYLREVIERQIDRLAPTAIAVLEAASLAGLHFSAAALAAALERPVAEVEAACAGIAGEHSIIVAAGTDEWPDGTISGRFGFAHALYREALAARVSGARGVELHRRIGERLARGYAARSDEVAAQLAMHFERARDREAALAWLRKAGDAAARRKASREAVAHYERALQLLAGLARGRERDEFAAALRLALCAPLIAMHGLGSPKVEAAARAALEACEALGDRRGSFAARRVLWNHSLMHYPVPATLRHANALMADARRSRRDVELALAHRALGCSVLYGGAHARAARLLERGVSIADRVADAEFDRYGEHPGMVCRGFGAWPAAFMGRAGEAVRLADASIRHARRRDDPYGLAFALVTAGLVHLFQRDVARADAVANEVHALSEHYALAQWPAFADEIRGWVAFQRGERAQGIELMQQALERLHATGARSHSSRVLANLAESCHAEGRLSEARRHLDAAFAHRAAAAEQYYAPELFRLHALLLRDEGAGPKKVRESFNQAVKIARGQGARLLVQRALRSSSVNAVSSSRPSAPRSRRTRPGRRASRSRGGRRRTPSG